MIVPASGIPWARLVIKRIRVSVGAALFMKRVGARLPASIQRMNAWCPERFVEIMFRNRGGFMEPAENGCMISAPYSGILSCFFQGFSTVLLRSMLSARQMRRRVLRG